MSLGAIKSVMRAPKTPPVSESGKVPPDFAEAWQAAHSKARSTIATRFDYGHCRILTAMHRMSP